MEGVELWGNGSVEEDEVEGGGGCWTWTESPQPGFVSACGNYGEGRKGRICSINIEMSRDMLSKKTGLHGDD